MTEKTYKDLIRLGEKYTPKIICGFLVGRREGKEVYVEEVREVITRTSRRWHFKPNWWNYHSVQRKIKKEGKQIVGEFHTHPNGVEELNYNDRKILRRLGFYYVDSCLHFSEE